MSYGYIQKYLKEILITCYLLFHCDEIITRIISFGSIQKSIFYVMLFALCALALYLSAYVRMRYIRVFYGLVFLISSVFFDTYSSVTASPLNYNSFISLLNAQEFAGDAFSQYLSPFFINFLIGTLLFVGIILKPQRENKLPNLSYILYPPAILLLIVSLVFYRGGDGETGLPPAFLTLTYSVLTVYEKATGSISVRSDVKLERDNKVLEKDIILIVDESIAPSYLDINSLKGVNTNLLTQSKNLNIYNYGYAASITTCSTESNISLRFGGTRQNYTDASQNMPSIWRYAKAAGLRTIYIDSQRTGKKLMNKMTSYELGDIDDFIQFDGIDVVSRDMKAASKLIELINNDTPEFIYINKVGGHFPVHDKYPDDFLIYKPVLSRGQHSSVTDEAISKNDYFSSSIDSWIRYRNSYRNTLLWNVGNFFDQLFTKADLQKATIIYTSDHGQNLHEDGSNGLATHCTNTKMSEGMVPLVVIDGKEESLNWLRFSETNKNSASHYNIFPTLLSLMSYKRDQLRDYYGVSLDQETKDDLTFNVNYHARLGGSARWMKVDIEKMVRPIRCDYEKCN